MKSVTVCILYHLYPSNLKHRIDNRGVLNVSGQVAIYGSSPLASRYLNINEQDFSLYIGMKSWIGPCQINSLFNGTPGESSRVDRLI